MSLLHYPTRVTQSLGYAGLIPFVTLALLPLFDAQYLSLSHRLLDPYALGIVSFMLGTIWRLPSEHIHSPASAGHQSLAAILSNVLFLTGLAVYIFAPQFWLSTAATILIVLYGYEWLRAESDLKRSGYLTMRRNLSVLACLSLFIAAYAWKNVV